MTRQLLVLIVGTLAMVPYAMKAQEPTPKNAAQPSSNQVYVKIIMPTDPADRDKDRPVVESWIAEDLKKRGQAKFTAVTGWVLLDSSPFGATDVWDGVLGDRSHCPVGADIPERAEGRIKVLLVGWHPGGACIVAPVLTAVVVNLIPRDLNPIGMQGCPQIVPKNVSRRKKDLERVALSPLCVTSRADRS